MTPAVTLALLGVFFLAGFVLRYWGELVEVRQLRRTAGLLRAADEDPLALEPSVVGTVLERTRLVLSTAKLARIVSLGLIVPGGFYLAFAWLDGDSRGGGVAMLVAAIAIFAGYLVCYAVAAWSAESEEDRPAPAWMTNSETHAPPVLVAGALAWEKVVEPIDRIMARVRIGRPQAQLFEQEHEIRLSVIRRNGAPPPGEKSGNGTPRPAKAAGERTEADMVRAIHRLDRTLVREIMRPINQVTAIRLRDYTPQGFLELCRRTGYTRVPVYERQITALIGFINVYDLLDEEELPSDLRELVSPALFVPEVARVDSVLQQLIAGRQQVAIVFDEFGGTSGLLSLEDIIEEIVGEVGDEYERPRRLLIQSRGSYLLDPSIDLDDLQHELGLELPKRNCDTIAGYIYYRLGRVPRPGETLEEQGWTIRVASVDGHRIRRIRLVPPNEPSED